MIQFPHCKINLGLSILGKRKDGFHDIDTVFYPVHLKDIVEITASSKGYSESIRFTHSGLTIPGDTSNNLCVKAYHLLKADFPPLPAVQMHLHKNIPMGAGLGGGSSDGTAVLQILNSLFHLQLNKKQLIQYAEKLGSDCPFFLFDQPCQASGKGEILNPIEIDLSPYTLILIHPQIHIPTPWAFQQIIPCKKEKEIAKIVQQPLSTWKQELVNDFEAPVMKAHPLIGSIKEELYAQGALYASMTGSGSSLFGLFPKGFTWATTPLTQNLRIDTF